MSNLIWVLTTTKPSEAHGLSWDWFFDKVAPPLAAGLAIALVGSLLLPRWNERFKGQRDHINQAVTDLRAQLAELQVASAQYWASKSHAGSSAEEAKIEYLIQDVSSLFDACDIGGGQQNRQDLITQLAAEIVTADFGTPNRRAEPDRARLVAVMAANIARVASSERRRYFHQSSLVRAVTRGWRWLSRQWLSLWPR